MSWLERGEEEVFVPSGSALAGVVEKVGALF
jgi:hypothetical protein